ncbi:MAG: Oligopeptide transport ATP-binding protein OppF [Syntrophorhabdaceae bacterium PtaU1.Bin034]|jgi:oligopeptide/dipeptide ABC transporter ATP-binding protein|nr:MAG: Oligopeptide transport ATP-binding protein OppF [Syntrophorhabdaceae bacterium PtaU1.Bin034]
MGQMLSVSKLTKVYEVRKTVFSLRKDRIPAVNNVSFDLDQGKTIGIVGESGSGKSTLAKCILLLERPDEGDISFKGMDWLHLEEKKRRSLRKDMQIIFQDPYSSLNPRKTILDIVTEPLLAHNMIRQSEAKAKAAAVLKNVGLDEDFLRKYPHEMSGGQRQRIAIGRALSTEPSLIIADEPVSSLDVSIQAQIINLFLDIKRQSVISMLFISHDLNIIRFVSDSIMVMYRGKVVEMAEKEEIFCHPLHPYTQMLINTAEGDLDNGIEEEPGRTCCAFLDRCRIKKQICAKGVPELKGRGDHQVACFLCDN